MWLTVLYLNFYRFKTEYNRQYLDDTEEAVRKNLLIQNLRFIDSGNREGATFELASNYLSDRLDAELEQLRGVQLSPENTRAEQFPHNRTELKDEEARLPDKFDWRPRGAVSPVRCTLLHMLFANASISIDCP